jgi:hypothetical protein
MQKYYKALLTFSLLVLSLAAYGFRTSADSLKIELLLTPAMADKINLTESLKNSVEITSDNLILLSSADQFYLLGWGGITPMGVKVTGNINAFAYTADSLLMTISNNELCAFGREGTLSRIYTLPSDKMGISSGKLVMYIYDTDAFKEKKSLFVIAHGGKYSKLFDVPAPIYSVAEMNGMIVFPNKNVIYQFDVISKKMIALASLPDDKTIKSVAADPNTGKIYFATDNMVFALKDKEISVITDKFGGTLKYFNGLIIFNPEKKLLVHISGLDKALDTRATEAKMQVTPAVKDTLPVTGAVTATPESPVIKIINNQSVIEMKKTGLSDDLIIAVINRNKVDFNLDVDSVIELSDNNVSANIIKAMRQALKNQHQETDKTDKNN